MLNVFEPAQRLLGWLGTAEGRTYRRISKPAAGRAHIELRGVHLPGREALAADAKAALEKLEGVDWAEVDGIVGRAIVMFDPEALSADDLIETLEEVEELHDVASERFPHTRADHPDDQEPIQRQVFGIVADVAGVGVAVTIRTLRFVAIPSEIPGVISLLDSRPRLRQFVEVRIGRPGTDVTFATANALAQALGQGPLGLFVDLAHRTGSMQELRARRSIWLEREPELITGRHKVGHAAFEFLPRPVPLPKGPVERYTDRAGIASLGAVTLALGVTRNPRRSADLLLTGISKTATLGREAFAAQLDQVLASHGVIAMDHAALRLLDRVDTLIIDSAVARGDEWFIDAIVPFDHGADTVECTARTRELFDAQDPRRRARRGAWVLEPVADRDTALPHGAKSQSKLLAHGGHVVLGLWHGDTLAALVQTQRLPVALVDECIALAREAGMMVHLAGGTDGFAARLDISDRILEKHLVTEIADLQRAGRVVMLVSGHDHGALRRADLGLGIEVHDQRVPWGAHLIVGTGFENVWRVLAAVPTARRVSSRSALLAFGGASTGGVWAFVGNSRGAAQRALVPINVSALLAIFNGTFEGMQSRLQSPPRPRPDHRWHELDPEEALTEAATTTDGLDADEQLRRRASSTAHVEDAPVGLGRALVDELVNPLTPLLALGAGLSAAVGSVTDAALVGGVAGINALVGAAQRRQTERAVAQLTDNHEALVSTRIAGEVQSLPSASLVVGDVIELSAGDRIPADCRLLEAVNLEIDESTITGESLPVAKHCAPTPGAPVAERASMLFEGSSVSAGDAVALVVAVGRDTEAGRSVGTGAAPASGVERRLASLTRATVPITLAGGAALTGIGFLYRRPPRDAVGAGVALMVAAIPEGLPALATLSQVAAARRLAKRNALVRNPRAIEALGRANQICFDKTGTLTSGAVALVSVHDGDREESIDALSERGRSVLRVALRATSSRTENATDRAVRAQLSRAEADDRSPNTLDEIPYESGRGYYATLTHVDDDVRLSVKGAPEVVFGFVSTWRRNDVVVPFDAAAQRRLEEQVTELGRRGLRVLAVAETRSDFSRSALSEQAPHDLLFVGFICLADPVRPSAAGAVRELARAGVRVAMVTGDHVSTAEATAAQLDMGEGSTLSGGDVDLLCDDELDAVIGNVTVFARMTPSHKARIVHSYQRIGRSVAMTGDGTNDAAAIRIADAGIALGGRATPAAHHAADVVVVDDRIETIVDAVIEGRAMWESVRDAVAILVGGNLGELGFTLFATSFTGRAPLNPRQLLLVNLLTDMAPALAIALREPSNRTPEALITAGPDASLGGALTREIAIRAGTTAVGATGAWAIASVTGTPTRARTVALAALVGTQLGQTVVAGGRSPLVLGATAISAGTLVATIQLPGVSQFFGCRPLGPVAWTTAISSAVVATAGSLVVPRVALAIGERVSAARGETSPGVVVPLPRTNEQLPA